ncbi:hypothetical protein B0186_05160 [Canicola haemoglobinophilus]|uniref:Type II secretory pathway, pseudopilin n=1 Tax=Canicola haemoglobinophilus TaxID=733 RepID=A0A1V4B1H3_9PAST|nr:DUF5374 domain-containing protein [Canicola haemoglobinophilus]OOS00969.1 hypothetical protein B0186_05160 [Canicola haemoglobinophilus]STO54876.1 Putative type II secretory pathway, pseudopilin [Canicola haemoglobinophilus]STO59146.1 Putative type II secretory pathway, pseudopilin [Canicola haemoglobinophilus]STO69553.1 Putative type II secretory pathway, pseudopilin [Canicola haemoglobinophilus]
MILTLYNNHQKGMSLVSLLVTMGIFSTLFLWINQWASQQRKSAVGIYLDYQALQIAENQHQRLFLEPTRQCQSVKQNGMYFKVSCYANRIEVSYANRQINLSLD